MEISYRRGLAGVLLVLAGLLLALRSLHALELGPDSAAAVILAVAGTALLLASGDKGRWLTSPGVALLVLSAVMWAGEVWPDLLSTEPVASAAGVVAGLWGLYVTLRTGYWMALPVTAAILLAIAATPQALVSPGIASAVFLFALAAVFILAFALSAPTGRAPRYLYPAGVLVSLGCAALLGIGWAAGSI